MFINIPAELRARPQWVVWQHEINPEGKAIKPPYRADGHGKASSTDSSTWTTFEKAVRAAEDGFDGIGFALSPDDPFCFVDLDGVIVEDGIHPVAQNIVRLLDSYTERSQSGGGVHVVIRAELNGDRNRTAKTPWQDEFEVYDHSRFAYLTGLVVDGQSSVEERQSQLEAVREIIWPPVAQKAAPQPVVPIKAIPDDHELLTKAFGAKNGAKLRALYEGDTGDYPSDSEADFALAGHLAFWAGPDPDRIERLMRTSSRARAKWDNHRTYLRETIARALDGRTEFWSGAKREEPSTSEPPPETPGGKSGTPTEPIEPVPLEDAVRVYQHWLYLPNPEVLYVAWGSILANRGEGESVWLLLVDVSGGGKTEVVRAVGDLPGCAHIAALTEAGLLSGTPRNERAKKATGGVLRVIGKKGIIVAKDFTSVLAMERDSRGKVLAALREVYDGDYTRQLGTDGGTELRWQGKVGFLGGVTPDIDHQYLVMARLGQRFVLHRPKPREIEDKRRAAQRALHNAEHLEEMRAELRTSALGVIAGADEVHIEQTDDEREWLVSLGMFVAPARAGVNLDYHGRVVGKVEPELPTRLVMQLGSLLGGILAIGVEREKALEAVRNTALSCIPATRKAALDYLEGQERVTTRAVALALGQPTEAAKKTLDELAVHGLTQRTGEQGRADEWELSTAAREALKAIAITPSGFSPKGPPEPEKSHKQAVSEPLGESPEPLPPATPEQEFGNDGNTIENTAEEIEPPPMTPEQEADLERVREKFGDAA